MVAALLPIILMAMRPWGQRWRLAVETLCTVALGQLTSTTATKAFSPLAHLSWMAVTCGGTGTTFNAETPLSCQLSSTGDSMGRHWPLGLAQVRCFAR